MRNKNRVKYILFKFKSKHVLLYTTDIHLDWENLTYHSCYIVTEWSERWHEHGIPLNATDYKVAFLCLLRWGHVLLASQQHMPPPYLPLTAPFLHHAQNWLCWDCCIDCNFILTSCVLLIYVQPLFLLPLLRLHNTNGDYYYCLLSSPIFPKVRVQEVPRFPLLFNGVFRCGTNNT